MCAAEILLERRLIAGFLLFSEWVLEPLHLGCPLDDAILLEIVQDLSKAALLTLTERQIVES